MSKLEIVHALSDSAPQPERLQVTIQLQEQISVLTGQVTNLIQALATSSQDSMVLNTSQRQQMLDLGALVEPIPELLQAVQKRQDQLEDHMKAMKTTLQRVTQALPPMVTSKDGMSVQPPLASLEAVKQLPAGVWKAKPPMFGKA